MQYLLYCSHCGNKHFTDGNNIDMIEIKSAPLPLRADGKTTTTKKLPRKFKCPQCGFILKPIKTEEKPPEKQLQQPMTTIDSPEEEFAKFEREVARLGEAIKKKKKQ